MKSRNALPTIDDTNGGNLTTSLITAKVSVAIATYNGEKYIEEQLTSIRDQSYPADEVIISDDQSTDTTVDIVRNFIAANKLLNWRLIVNSTNLGFCSNFWNAIQSCSGDLVFISDQDDIWHTHKISSTLSIFTDDQINLVASSYDLCDSKGDVMNTQIRWHRRLNNDTVENISFENIVIGSRIRGCSMAFRKIVLKDEKLFDLSNNLGHDWLITFYALMKGRAVFYNRVLFKYRIHGSNLSLNAYRNKKSSARLKASKMRTQLEEELTTFTNLLSHPLLSRGRKELLNKKIHFTDIRINLYNQFHLKNCLMLLFKLNSYVAISPIGIIGVLPLYARDVVYSYNLKDAHI